MKKLSIQIFLLFLVCSVTNGQTGSLSLEEAITIGLKNNFSIQIATNDNKIAVNNNTLGNAGFLPSVNLNGQLKENIFSTDSKDQNGVSTNSNNLHSGTASLGATFDWTLFNGMGMFIKKDRLGSLQSYQETSLRATVENKVSEIITAYFAVVQLKNSIEVLQNAINFSNRRYDLTRKKLQIGTTSELAFLKSSTDLNADSASFLRQHVALTVAKSKLNALLVQETGKDYEVTSAIRFDQILDYNGLKEVLQSVNSQISMAKQSVDIALLDYRLTHSPQYPQVAFFTDYNLTRSKYNYGSTSMVVNSGPVVGINLSLPIFDGLNKRRVAANAKIDAESTKLEYEKVLKDTEETLWQIYNEYKTNLKLVTLETANLEVAKTTSKISFERFRVGAMSDYELRDIQLAELEAENSLLVALFMAKKSETELLRLSGKLIESKVNK
ncbi:MAG: TolC family protein [Prolixibacteraceae bacterium]